MNPTTILRTIYDAASNPVNARRRIGAAAEYGFRQVAARSMREVCIPLPNGLRLLVSANMKGAAHYISPTLFEFESMAFVMHALKPQELFVDIGANIGIFSILAAGVVGSKAVAIEPNRSSFEMLSINCALNRLNDRMRCVKKAVGASRGITNMTSALGTENHICDHGETVPMTTLDDEIKNPALIKVDVEGFEEPVFKGATRAMVNPSLLAVIVEKSGLGNKYGFDEDRLHHSIISHGFISCGYDAFNRHLKPEIRSHGNIIYVRDTQKMNARLKEAQPFVFKHLTI